MRMRRRVAVLAAFGMATGVALVVPSTVAANDLVNGDFGTGDTAGWNAYPNPSVVDGAGCIDVPAGTGAYGAGILQNVTLAPDTDYVVSFTARLLDGSGTPGPIRTVVQLPRDPYTQYLPEQAIAGQLSTTPASFDYAFTTPSDLPPSSVGDPDGPNAEFGIQQNGATTDGYVLCVDDVVLEPAGTEQVANGGFDDGIAGWTSMYPNAAVIDGFGCVTVPPATGAYGAGIGQLVTLDPDTDYSFTFTAKLLDGSGTPGPIRAVVQLPRDPYTQYLPEQAIAGQLGTTPTDFEFNFTTPADLPPATDGGDPAGPHAELTIQQNGATVDGYTLCVDDVSLLGGSEPEPYTPDTASRVRVNQVGYFAHGPKHATLVTDSLVGVGWELHDAAGSVVAAGTSAPYGFDDAAGLDVHTIDFSDVTTIGDGFTLVADGETSFPFEIGVGDVYDQLRYDALNYYYPARSGIEIDGAIAGAEYARAAGHVSSPADGVANTGDVDVPCQSIDNQTSGAGDFYYGSEWACPTGYTLDVVGGWYDAGDHGKYVVNGGISVAQLMSTYERAKTAPTADTARLADGTLNVPESGNGVPDVLDEARWELEWMLTMQVPAGSGEQLIDGTLIDVSGMVHHKVHDEGWTGLPLMPAADPQVRSLHRPSTSATLNLAAAAAQGARLWAPYDRAFAAELVDAAETAYAAARAHPSVFAPAADGGEGGGPYNDDDVSDEFYWAAVELFLTTGGSAYRDDVTASPVHTTDAFPDGGFSWDDLAAIARMDLATVPNDLADRDRVIASVLQGADDLLAVQAGEPFGHPYAGDADGNYVWGSNSQVLNNLVVLGVAFDLSGDEGYRTAVMEGMDYLLGRNSLNWSYVTGYGEAGYTSENQHSRWWAAQLDPGLPHPPPGTVSGGPNSTSGTWDPVAQSLFVGQGCAPQRCYVDDIQSWSTNELTVNWNAPMAWVANFLADQGEGEPEIDPVCTVDYTSRRLHHGRQLVTIEFRNDSDSSWRGWTLDWSYLGGELMRFGLGGDVGQDGADVTVSSRSDRVRVRPGRTVVATFLVDARFLPGDAPERFRSQDGLCETGPVRWWQRGHGRHHGHR